MTSTSRTDQPHIDDSTASYSSTAADIDRLIQRMERSNLDLIWYRRIAFAAPLLFFALGWFVNDLRKTAVDLTPQRDAKELTDYEWEAIEGMREADRLFAELKSEKASEVARRAQQLMEEHDGRLKKTEEGNR